MQKHFIGCGPNGDDLLVHAKTLEVYFWDHETAKHNDSRFKSDCAKLYDIVTSLLLHVRNRDYVPWDSFQAKDYYAMHKGLWQYQCAASNGGGPCGCHRRAFRLRSELRPDRPWPPSRNLGR
jgi:hypothetical protein